MPHGIPTKPPGSELNEAGFSQRRVMAGLRRADRRMARPRDDRSPADVYMLPVLDVLEWLEWALSQGWPCKLTVLPRPCHSATSLRHELQGVFRATHLVHGQRCA